MSDRIFVDTNVLVYAYDRSEAKKQAVALDVLDRLAASRAGAISAQVLSEFFVAVTRKIAEPLSVDEGCERVTNLLQAWPVIDLTGLIALEATRGVREHRLSYWDAMIWATARLNQIPIIFSEDFSSNTSIEGVRIVNPFAANFRIDDWV